MSTQFITVTLPWSPGCGSVGFPRSKVNLLLCFPTLYSLEESPCTWLIRRVQSYVLPPWRHSIHTVIWSCFVRDVCLFCPVCLFSYVFIWTHGCLFCIIVHDYFVTQIVPSLATGSGSSLSLLLLIYPHHCGVLLGTSLLSGTRRFSRLILYISCPSPRITHFSKEHGSYFLRMVLATKISVLATGVRVVASGSSHLMEQGHTCVCTKPRFLSVTILY